MSIKNHAPEIMTVSGIGCMTAAGIIGCVKSAKLPAIKADIDEKNEQIDLYWEKVQDGRIRPADGYTEEDYNNDKAIMKGQLIGTYIKTYALPVGLGLVGMGLILAGQRIMRKRWLTAVAALDLVTEKFESYRQNIISEYGEDADIVGMTGMTKTEVEAAEIDPETGKRSILLSGVDGYSMYSFKFDRSNVNWVNNPDSNHFFVQSVQINLNEKLKWSPHNALFLADVYDAFDYVPLDEEGKIDKRMLAVAHQVGWIMEDPATDFVKILPPFGQVSEDGSMVIDPNVQGEILSKLMNE